jgi:hypothetical protein
MEILVGLALVILFILVHMANKLNNANAQAIQDIFSVLMQVIKHLQNEHMLKDFDEKKLLSDLRKRDFH